MTRELYGHKTLIDGSHVPLTEDEANALWQMVEDADAKRAADMPTARDALSMLIAAQERLNDLGWRKGGGLRVKRGDECGVAQMGSTGMWRGRVDEDGKYVYFADCVAGPRECYLKPLAELSDDEQALMEECDRSEAEYLSAQFAALPREGEQG